MAKKRSTRGPKRVSTVPGSRTAEVALIHRLRGWYAAHLETVASDDPHLSADEVVAVITDMFELTRDVKPSATFAAPDAALLDALFAVFDDEIEDDDELDGMVVAVAAAVEHYLDFLSETGLWKGDDDELQACYDALDDILDPEEDLDLTLTVSLDGAEPAVWRRLLVSSLSSVRELHQAIQLSFAWTDSEPHRVIVGDESSPDAIIGSVEDGDVEGADAVDEDEVQLGDLFIEEGEQLLYVYGPSGEWRHTITLDAIEEQDDEDEDILPRCIAASGVAPLEGDDEAPASDGSVSAEEIDHALRVLRLQ